MLAPLLVLRQPPIEFGDAPRTQRRQVGGSPRSRMQRCCVVRPIPFAGHTKRHPGTRQCDLLATIDRIYSSMKNNKLAVGFETLLRQPLVNN